MYSISKYTYFIKKGEKFFVYNSTNGKKFICNDSTYNKIVNINNTDIESEQGLVEQLLNMGIIEDEARQAIIENSFVMEQTVIETGWYISNLRLNLTTGCNLRCKYCFENKLDSYSYDKTMSWEMAKKSIDSFCSLLLKNKKTKGTVRFFGGEPLLNWNVLVRSVEYIESKYSECLQLNLVVNTNGTLIDDDKAKFFCKHNVLAVVSLDGVKKINDINRVDCKGNGSFSLVEKGLNSLAENMCYCNIAVVVSGNNIESLKELIDYLMLKYKKTGLNFDICFSFIHISSDKSLMAMETQEIVNKMMAIIHYARTLKINVYGGFTHQVFQNMMKPNGGKHCVCLGAELSVHPEGKVFPCDGLGIELGNIDDIEGILKGDEYADLVKRRSGYIEHCKDCPIEYYCAGGCYADFLSDDGKSAMTCRNKQLEIMMFRELVKEYLL